MTGKPLYLAAPLTAEEAFRCASFGIELEHRQAFARHLGRGDTVDFDPIDESRIADILCWPPAYAPRNPYYVKSHATAPGTVRAWFRRMRAEEFWRDAAKATSTEGGYFWKVHTDLQGWTLFDTLKVVDRETAAHYAKPGTWGAVVRSTSTPRPMDWIEEMFTLFDLPRIGRVVAEEHDGRIVPVDEDPRMFGTPAALMGVEPTHRPEYLGIDRSIYPMFSSKVQSEKAPGITLDDIRRFVEDDERRRPERRR